MLRKAIIIFLCILSVGVAADAQRINILSLNNSLIDYNNQPAMFNDMAEAMGRDAHWNARTQLGRTLLYHYNDAVSYGLAMSGGWDYVVLQEQSSLPGHYQEIFMQSVELWKRAFLGKGNGACPTIILPMNWAYSDNWQQFKESTARLKRSYLNVCREIPGIIVCPVGIAYEILYDNEGEEACSALYTDNRHPSLKASYLAACMEYAVIFGQSPLSVTYVPEGLSVSEAQKMRKLANAAMTEWEKELRVSR